MHWWGGGFLSKTKVILCVFSGSDVGSKWRLLYSLLHPTTKHLNRLGVILVYSCSGVKTMVDSSQLTQSGSMLKCQCSSTDVGGACLCHINLTRICERLDLRWCLLFVGNKKKKALGVFLSCSHTANTHVCSNIM